MGNIKLKSKGIRIEINIKKGKVNDKEISKSLQSNGFKISPPIPNMPTLAISSDMKCMLSGDKLEIQMSELKNLTSNIKTLKNVIKHYTETEKNYQMNFDTTFLISGKLNVTDIVKAIFNPRAQSKAKLYVEPIGFRVIIEQDKIPFIFSFEGSKETNNAVSSILFSVNSKEQFFNAVSKIDTIVIDLMKKINFFAKNELSYRHRKTSTKKTFVKSEGD